MVQVRQRARECVEPFSLGASYVQDTWLRGDCLGQHPPHTGMNRIRTHNLHACNAMLKPLCHQSAQKELAWTFTLLRPEYENVLKSPPSKKNADLINKLRHHMATPQLVWPHYLMYLLLIKTYLSFCISAKYIVFNCGSFVILWCIIKMLSCLYYY